MSKKSHAKLERWVYETTGLTWWRLDSEIQSGLREVYHEAMLQEDTKPAPTDDVVAEWALVHYGAYFFLCTLQQKENWRRYHEADAT